MKIAGGGIRRPTTTGRSHNVTTLQDVMAGYDLVDVVGSGGGDGSALVVTPKQFAAPSEVDIRELGTTQASSWTGWLNREYNTVLRAHQGIRKYDEMRRSDSTIQGTLLLCKTPVLGARWFIEPASDSTRDVNIAKKVWWNLTEGMSTSWPQFVNEALLMLDFGYYLFEKVFETSNRQAPPGMGVTWKKFAPRHPDDVTEWHWDANGGPLAATMMGPHQAGNVTIPVQKLLIFTHRKEAGDVTGISLLRTAFKPWYYKTQLEKIDAIQKERHGIGVPIIKLPPGFTLQDKALAQEIGRNLRTNEQAHIILPPNWEITFADIGTQPVDVLKSVEYHNKEITKNILATFLETGGGKDDDRVLFLKSTRTIADVIVDVINKWAIPELVDLNWKVRSGYPKLCARRIGEQADWRTMSFAIRNLIGAGVILPDEKLEENMREEMDLPKADPSTTRLPATERVSAQAGPPPNDPNAPAVPAPGTTPTPNVPGQKAKMPRQKPTPPVGLPAKNAGTDRSGG